MSKVKFGVPCSWLKDRITDTEIPCSCEEEALAIAAGTWLAGKKPEVYMQNSGLCRSIDYVLSLYKPYEIPLPKLTLSIRHEPYHHHFCGKNTRDMLAMLEWDNVELVEQKSS
jgi:phosphonopyruvate decarboxylase